MNFHSIFLYIILPAVAGLYFFLKKKYSYFEDRGIPHLKPSWIYGNMTGVGKTSHLSILVKELYEKFHEKDVISGLYSLTQPIYIITDLDVMKSVLIKDFNKFVNRGAFLNEENEPITANLFGVEDNHWRFLRNKLSPAFTSGKIKLMFEVMRSKGDTFVKAIEKKSQFGSVEVKDIAHRYTVDTIASVAFGMEANTLSGENEDLSHYSKEAFGSEGASAIVMFLLLSFPKLAKFLNVRQFTKRLSDYFHGIISENIKYRESSEEKRNDFLDMLVQLKNKGSIDGEISRDTIKLTLNQCVAQGFIFILGGSGTSSTTISFAICEIAKNVDIQEKLRAEIIEKTKSSNGEITYDNLQEMTYLNQVMNEILRMYPVGFVQLRIASEDFEVPNSKHVIPKGSQVWIPTIGIHFDKQHWKNPDKFDPEHFSKEQVEQRNPMAFIPFGDGPRNCIGMRFGQLSVKFGLATILKNFKVSLDSRTKFPLKVDPEHFELSLDGGAWIKFEKL